MFNGTICANLPKMQLLSFRIGCMYFNTKTWKKQIWEEKKLMNRYVLVCCNLCVCPWRVFLACRQLNVNTQYSHSGCCCPMSFFLLLYAMTHFQTEKKYIYLFSALMCDTRCVVFMSEENIFIAKFKFFENLSLEKKKTGNYTDK